MGAYVGASLSRRELTSWKPDAGSPDADSLEDLETLRGRCRDLARNTPYATGGIGTAVTNVVGSGLRLKSMLDREALGMGDEEADSWERQTEREWQIFSESREVDASRRLTFPGLCELAFRSVLDSGDLFVLLPSLARGDHPYRTKLQLIEADRCENPHGRPDTDELAGGVEIDRATGAPVAYHFRTTHPGETKGTAAKWEWQKVDAFSRNGRPRVLHLYRMLRPDQRRGIPFLAPIVLKLKQLDRYADSELQATVLNSFFTVFIKAHASEFGPLAPVADTGAARTDDDIKLGSGVIAQLNPGEDIVSADPKRPNQSFEAFVNAVIRQVGSALEIPFEMLVKHFQSSYSASRAAMLEAWRFFLHRRAWLVTYLCQPTYELFLTEAVLSGRIVAPGFLTDVSLRRAYSKAQWIGPARGQIDEQREVGAARDRLEIGVSTLVQETAQLTGGDWEANHKQQVREKRMRERDGLEPGAAGAGSPASEEQPFDPDRLEREREDLP